VTALPNSWGREKPRFVIDKEKANLGPGTYEASKNTVNYTSSSFKSKAARFKPLKTTSISPGSYSVHPLHIETGNECYLPGWKPWVETLSTKLSRVLVPPEPETLRGTPMQILEALSVPTARGDFVGARNKLVLAT
jgi:hypothetical protein